MSSRDKVLELLEFNRDNYLSGEAIATQLGLSRNAIWKAINELRKAGYVVDAVSNKGYKLAETNDILSSVGILSYINKSLRGTYDSSVNMIRIYDTVSSTNRIAKELAIAGMPHGTVIVASEQTEGRGRRDHSFYSPKGGLYLSILLKPEHLKSLEPDVVTTFTGNAVVSAIEALTDIKPRLKPINDLYIDDKKICGILTEAGTEFETGEVKWLVVGIGINYDSNIEEFPEDIKKSATSLFAPGASTITKNQLVAEILNRILIN